MEKEFQVYGTITIQVELDIVANSEEEAIELVKEQLKDDYNLDVHGYAHTPGEEEIDLTAIEYND
jgi:predicted deacetylase